MLAEPWTGFVLAAQACLLKPQPMLVLLVTRHSWILAAAEKISVELSLWIWPSRFLASWLLTAGQQGERQGYSMVMKAYALPAVDSRLGERARQYSRLR